MRYIALVVFAFFTACSIKPDAENSSLSKTYLIDYSHIEAVEESKRLDKSVQISIPNAPIYLKTYNITYTKGDGDYGSYLYNHWSETPAKQLQFLMANATRESKIFQNVIIAPSIINSDFTIESRIDKFEYFINTDESHVNVQVDVFLVDNETKKAHSRYFKLQTDVKDINPQGVVTGFNKTMQEFDKELIKWIENVTAKAN